MKLINNEMKNYFSNDDKYKKMPNIVYHYCSLQTFVDIIMNSTVRLSHITKSNDMEEIKYIMPFVETAILKAVKEYNQFVAKDYKISSCNISDAIEKIFNELSTTFYAACFSEVNDLVDQWARYADHAKGVAIGFSTNSFVKLQISSNSEYIFNNVIYDANYVMERLIEMITKSYNERCVLYDDGLNFLIMTDVIREYAKTILRHSPLYKNPAFSQEREWRLIYNPFGRLIIIPDRFTYFDKLHESNVYNNSNYSVNRSVSRCNVKYRVVDEGRQLTSYIDLNFNEIKTDLIREIIIGNQSKLTTSDIDLMSFLKMNGYNISNTGLNNTIKISKSTIPYNK